MLALAPHPSTPDDAWDLSALAERTAHADLRLRYVLRGALDAMHVPAAGPPRRGDRLWEHTCAEAFVAAEGASAYVELNVSPSRQWAAYAFTSPRVGGPLAAPGLEPRIVVRRNRETLAIDVRVALADLSSEYAHAALRVGLTMVVEAADGRLSYWALHHPTAQPDFHHPDGFTLRLAAPRAADGDRGSSP
ncbi:MAG: DOMON-like domain-containing protein [Deltaproteobacteria bacterium]|nr:DOMON-like domain-containing protein [Deltaproteobacteria bacterium]